jgi:hypothetical protein
MTLPDGSVLEDDFSGADLTALPVTGTHFAISEVAGDRFRIDTPTVAASRIGADGVTSVQIDFDCVVLRTGTEFAVEALLLDAGEVSQLAVAGNARSLSEGSQEVRLDPANLAVHVDKTGSLLTNVRVDPPVLTPNGDGINDVVTIHFDVAELIGGGDLAVRIYDLGGRLVRVVEDASRASGRYTQDWDGRDGAGNVVPPGIYVFEIDMQADAGDAARSGTIAVAY